MAETVIGALSVKITADTQGVQDGLKATGKSVNLMGKQLRSSANDWGKWAVAGTAATVAIGAAIIKMNLTAIRELKNTAFAANTTVEEFQRGAFAAEQLGISTEKYGDILKDVNDRVGDFVTSGAGPMVDFFEQIGPKVGITADAFKGLSGQESLGLYVKSLEEANLNQAEMTFFMEAMASDSTRLIPLFAENGKQLKFMSEEAKALGIGLSAIDVEKAEQASTALAKSAASTQALTDQLTVELAPIISGVTDLFVDMAKNAGGASQFITQGLDGVISVIGVFADGLHGIRLIFKTLEVAAIGFSALAVSVFEVVTNVIATSMDGWLMMVNDTILTINKAFNTDLEEIPAVRDSAFVKSVGAVGDNMRGLVSETNAELHDLAMQQLPSDSIRQFVDDAQVEFERLAVAKVNAENEAAEAKGDEFAGTKKVSETAVFEAETIGLLEAMGLRFESQEEMELAHLQRMAEMNNANLEAGRITALEHSEEMVKIKQQEEETKRAITLSNVQQGFQMLISNSKKAQKVMQGIAVFNAVVKGKESAVAAWSAGMATGGPFAPVVAAAYTAASIAKTAGMINSIKSGGKSQGSSGGGGLPSVPSGSGSSGGGQQAQQVSSPRSIDINFSGSGLLNTDQVRELIGQINEQVGDGVELVIGA